MPTKLADGLELKDALLASGEIHPRRWFLRSLVSERLGRQRLGCGYSIPLFAKFVKSGTQRVHFSLRASFSVHVLHFCKRIAPPPAPSPLGRKKIFRPNGEGESKDGVVRAASPPAPPRHPPSLLATRGERRQGDERGLLKSTAAKFMPQADLPPRRGIKTPTCSPGDRSVCLQSGFGTQNLHLVHLFPRSINIVPTKVTVRRGRLINRTPQIQIANDRGGAQIEMRLNQLRNLFV